MTRFKITVLTLQGSILTFSIDEYKETEGGFIEFVDQMTGQPKKFHGSRCEISEAKNG